jgi:hypothetical protein
VEAVALPELVVEAELLELLGDELEPGDGVGIEN